ncbi:hypothetical protein ACFWA9_37625 [Kitasatospora sp. NPDC059973]|uniref:hypothetical protein n=1 Tax=Kitasatospora sp. NPDC059973 TaxID=3347020 RepID=UPI0036C86A23
MTAGGVGLLAMLATSGAFGVPVGAFGDEAGFLFGVLLMLGLLVQLPLLIGACTGWLIGSLSNG